ncbi:MAG: hypothetical protein ACLR9W_01990 [Enterobacter hormaechei]
MQTQNGVVEYEGSARITAYRVRCTGCAHFPECRRTKTGKAFRRIIRLIISTMSR